MLPGVHVLTLEAVRLFRDHSVDHQKRCNEGSEGLCGHGPTGDAHPEE